MAFNIFRKLTDLFRGRDPTFNNSYDIQVSGSNHPYYSFTSKRSLITAIYNRIAVDVSTMDIKHVRLKTGNEYADRQYKETIVGDLNDALTLDANLDQTSRDMIKQLVLTLFDKGSAALVPILTDVNPETTDAYTVKQIRVGEIVAWYPYSVRIDVYREETGRHEQIVLDKRIVPIIYNPFYEIMNEPNSKLQQLLRANACLEKTNRDSTSGKLDLIIQLPYVIRDTVRQKQAEMRKKSIEEQLNNSKYGIAYTDGTEKIIQLNRSLENNLWAQVKEIQTELYNQMGITPSILDGTADENVRLNYYNSTIEPILSAITEEIERKWLSKTARRQGQAIMYFRNPFKLIPVSEVAKMADTFTRNEIATSNEFRSILGFKPSKDKKADQLINSNLNQSKNSLEELKDPNIQNE